MSVTLCDKTQAPRRALVIGMGASGLACAEYLLDEGWTVTVADTRENPPGLERLAGWERPVALHPGGLPESLIDGVTLLVLSPGISPVTGPAAALVRRAAGLGIDIVGEIELFARALQRLKAQTGYTPKVIGITGTNGKTTTTALTGKMIEKGGQTCVVAGNIGPNALTELKKAVQAAALPQVWVLELSSFQLQTLATPLCDAAAVLNITEDHLDWHGGMDGYVRAKARIFADKTVRVLNRDDATMPAFDAPGATRLTFGHDAPVQPGQFGLLNRGGVVSLACFDAKRGAAAPLMPESRLELVGRHNTMNALAALALIDAVGADRAAALDALTVFKAQPHRVERVLETDGVVFVDDSKGTNVGAVQAAVEGFAAQNRRLLIILGGDGKGQDFSPLARALEPVAGAVALIGKDAPMIHRALAGLPAPVQGFDSLPAAVRWLWTQHRHGDVLLLSPACASWDMFANYVERSRCFVDCARAIQAGEALC